MGLDMYAFTTATRIGKADFKTPSDAQLLFYWRKHPNLHGWMEELYRHKGRCRDVFNVAPVRLDPTDLDALEKAVRENTLSFTQGFFFGASYGAHRTEDERFIHKAREAIAKGQLVYYTSSW